MGHQNQNQRHPKHTTRHHPPDEMNSPQRKLARHNEQIQQRQNHTNIHHHIEPYLPTSIHSQILPLESSQQMQTEYDGRKLINFGCIGYDSLVKYCKMFKLHQFEYDYHYDLAGNNPLQHSNANSCARITKQENEQKKDSSTNKRKFKKKKRGKKNDESQHFYRNSDALDVHYEKAKRESIPKSFVSSSRLTKSELVEIVSEHFLSQPLLAEYSEIDVIKQFLLFIQARRQRLKKEFYLSTD